MFIDYSSFEKAITQLKKSLSFYHSEMSKKDEELQEQFRAAVIQAFEYTYELGIKMLKRQLEEIVPNPSSLREISFMELIRTAYQAGLVREVIPFKVYREHRNITSHTYEEDIAEEILSGIDLFVEDMQFILDQLKCRNKDDKDN